MQPKQRLRASKAHFHLVSSPNLANPKLPSGPSPNRSGNLNSQVRGQLVCLMHKHLALVDCSGRTQVLVKREEFSDSSSQMQAVFSVSQHRSIRTRHKHPRVCSGNSQQAVVCSTRISQRILHLANKLRISKRKVVVLAVFLVSPNSSLRQHLTSHPPRPEACLAISHNRQEVFLGNNRSRINPQLVGFSRTLQTLVQEVFLQPSLLQEGCLIMVFNNSSQVASLASNNNNNNLPVDYLRQSLPLVVAYSALLNKTLRHQGYSNLDLLKEAGYSGISQPPNRQEVF